MTINSNYPGGFNESEYIKNQEGSLWLIVIILIMILMSLYGFLLINRTIESFSFFLYFGPSLLYLLIPSYYLYIRSLSIHHENHRFIEVIHLLPFLFFLIDCLPFILLNQSDRINVYRLKNILYNDEIAIENTLLTTGNTHYYFKLLLAIIYLALQKFLIIRFLKFNRRINNYNRYSRWMYLVASSYFFIFLAPYIYTPFIDKEVGAYFSLAFLNLIIIVFIISIFLNPEIIRSPSYFIQKKQYNIEINKKIIDPDKIKEIEKALQITIIHKKQYLQKKYSLPRLSEETKIPIHHLSAYLNQYLHITFNDFINKYRVEYIKQILNNKSYHQHLRLESLAEDAGFGNRTTFISAFKKFTGVTPSEYIKINHDEPDAKKNN